MPPYPSPGTASERRILCVISIRYPYLASLETEGIRVLTRGDSYKQISSPADFEKKNLRKKKYHERIVS